MSEPIVIRGQDCHGCGDYLASRGKRKHNGIDIEVKANEAITAYVAGTVTKIGYPYNPNNFKKGKYRYIEITTDKLRLRYFYVGVLVELGDIIERGQIIGWSQDLDCTYPGITQHFHFEVKQPDDTFINPIDYLEDRDYVFTS